MKKLLVLIITVVGVKSFACPSLSGKYIDGRGLKDVIKISADCSQVSWLVDYVQPTTLPLQKYPASQTLFIDGVERVTAVKSSRASIFTKGSYDNKYLIFDERVEDADGYVVSRTRTFFSAQYSSVSQLVEARYSVSSDDKMSLEYTRVYSKIH